MSNTQAIKIIEDQLSEIDADNFQELLKLLVKMSYKSAQDNQDLAWINTNRWLRLAEQSISERKGN
jgi:hypothetical protein